MKLVNTLPFRPDLSNFLSNLGLKKDLIVIFCSLVILLVSGCSQNDQAKELEVEVWFNGSPLACDTFSKKQRDWTIRQLAFFISNVELIGEESSKQARLSTTPWQTNNLALIQPQLQDCDKVEGSAAAPDNKNYTDVETLESNNLRFNDNVQFLLPVDLGSYEQLAFTLAVPFDLNHQNPLQQPSPLNLPTMFWSWRSGHKFLRLDMQSLDRNWVFHLGSVGCEAATTMRAPVQECVQPNRVNFRLDKKDQGTKLVMHLDRLIDGVVMAQNESCLFHTGQESCSTLMANLKSKSVFEWL